MGIAFSVYKLVVPVFIILATLVSIHDVLDEDRMVDCFDNHGNRIIGLQCEHKANDITWSIIGLPIIYVMSILGYLFFKREDNKEEIR